MKKFTRWALCLGLCLGLLVCGALADEAPGITVQLDGQNLTFTDAVPQVKDQRTFLPFRAVFEAMGAQVDYEGSVITAVRGDKSLTMTLGQTTAAVTESGVTTPIAMDVAPYVDPATWRTYVPVRFAAQAFGCVVGWDQEAQTAIVIDTDKLVNAAMEGKSFAYLEKLAAMSEGIWDVTATFDADVDLVGIPMTMSGTASGTVQDGNQASIDMDMKVGTNSVALAARGEMASGKLYLNMDMGALNAQTKVDPAAWYELDMVALMEQAGTAWADVMTVSNMDMLDVLTVLFSGYQPTNAATAYTDVKTMVEAAVAAFCDEGFVQVDGQYVTTYTVGDDNATTLVLVLDMAGETLKGYVVGVDMTTQDKDGRTTDTSVSVSLDDKGQMDAKVTMDMGGLMDMTMTMEGAYTPGITAPVTAPPAGVKVLPFTALTGNVVQAN